MHDVALTGKKVMTNEKLADAIEKSTHFFPCCHKKHHSGDDDDPSSDDDDDDENGRSNGDIDSSDVDNAVRNLGASLGAPKGGEGESRKPEKEDCGAPEGDGERLSKPGMSETPVERLLGLLLPGLGDSIHGVREAVADACAAIAANCDRRERRKLKALLYRHAREMMEQIESEPVPEGKTKDDVFDMRDQHGFENSVLTHSMQASFGCCSLDTKDEQHLPEPWEKACGGVLLLRALVLSSAKPKSGFPQAAQVPGLARLNDDDAQLAMECVPALVRLGACRWFAHYPNVQSVLRSIAPVLAENLGRNISPYLHSLPHFG